VTNEHPFHYYRSPSEIREVQFSHRIRGIDEYEVAEYLDLLADQVHASDLELRRLREENDHLRAENDRLRSEGDHRAAYPPAPVHAESDAHPKAASLLLNAQRVADDLVEEAVRRTRDMLAVARAEKNAILRNAQEAAAAMMAEARESREPQEPRESWGQHASPPAQPPTDLSVARQRSWQLDGHAAV
jgi:DivIVA domain-containing protein